MNELIRSRMRTRNLDFRMTSYISQKYDVKGLAVDHLYIPVESEAGTSHLWMVPNN